jgi:hypothetical protein
MFKSFARFVGIFLLVLTSFFGAKAQPNIVPTNDNFDCFIGTDLCVVSGQNVVLIDLSAPIQPIQNSEKKSEENKENEEKDDEVREHHKSNFFQVYSAFSFAEFAFFNNWCSCFCFENQLARRPKRSIFILNHQWKNDLA